MYEHKLAGKKLTQQLAATLLEKARDQIPSLLDAYASGRTITSSDGTVYAVYVVSLINELKQLGYEFPKRTEAELGSW